MARIRSRPAVIAAVAVLALGFAAATLNSAVAAGGGVGTRVGSGTGAGEQSAGQPGGSPLSLGLSEAGAGGEPAVPLPCVSLLNDPRFILAVLGLTLVGGYALYRRTNPLVPVAVLAAVGPPAVVVHALLTDCSGTDRLRLAFLGREGANATLAVGPGPGAGGGGGASTAAPAAPLALLAVLGVALIAAVAVLVRSTGDDTAGAAPPEEDDEGPTAAVRRAAGRAADGMERSADPENAVYRAWHEMTEGLAVGDPETTTPAEFAEAAVEAGLDPDAVAELTALFEDVRYGGVDPTPEREERAVAILRRIESGEGKG